MTKRPRVKAAASSTPRPGSFCETKVRSGSTAHRTLDIFHL